MSVPNATDMVLAELKRRLELLYGERLYGVFLFGSHARGEATTDSDIDVLIVPRGAHDAREERKRTLPVVAELSLAHNVLISDIITSEHEYQESRLPLFRAVRREGLRQ